MPAPIRAGLKLAHAFDVLDRVVLGRLRRPVGEERRALLAQRALQRHADAHPAVVVELGVRQPGERAPDRGQRTSLCMRRQTRVPGPVCALRTEALRAHLGRDQRQRLVEKSRSPVGVDFGQALDVEIREPLVRPGIGLAGVGMLGIGHELLSEAQNLERRAPDPGEGLSRAIDQQPLRCLADPERGRVAQPLAGQLLDVQRQFAILGNIDVERGDRTADDPDAAVGPAGPGRDLELGRGAARMPVPLRVVVPGRAGELAGLLGAGRDRQDRVAVGHETRPDTRHPRGVRHQKGTSGIMPSSRARSFAARSRRWSQ